jgi:hypothetical protein
MSEHHLATNARRAEGATERVVSNSLLELLERVGYVVRGVLYSVMGTLALGVALGVGGTTTDQSGSLIILTRGPWGRAILLVVAIGLGAYALWGFVRAIFDPLQRGESANGIAQRLGFAWSGIAYTALTLFALNLFAGTSQGVSHDTTQSTISRILTYPAGEWAAAGIGLIAIVAGLAQFVEAYRAEFRRDLKRAEMTAAEQKIVDMLGRLGMVARGITFTLVGWFVLQAGLHRNPTEAKGFKGAFLFLLQQPHGRQLLAIVAIGFIALGLHSFACARWVRLLGSRT